MPCRGRRREAFTLVELLVVVTIIALLVALLLPAVQSAREAARRAQCLNGLKQFGIGMYNYESVHGCFPAGAVRRFASNNSAGAQSSCIGWIARTLMFMEQDAITRKIDWEIEPGSSGSNATLMAMKLPICRCPSDPAPPPLAGYGPTNYMACVGYEDLTDPGHYSGAFGINSFMPAAQISDGLSQTMFLSECKIGAPWQKYYSSDTAGYNACLAGTEANITGNSSNNPRGYSWFSGVRNLSWCYNTWFRPNDPLSSNHECELWTDQGRFAARSYHPGGVNVAMGDASVRFVIDQIDPTTWVALGSRAKGEPIGQY